MGEWAFLRMSHSAIQSNSQPGGKMSNEPELCAHREMVCEALRER